MEYNVGGDGDETEQLESDSKEKMERPLPYCSSMELFVLMGKQVPSATWSENRGSVWQY
jgi:hypothetical protein